MKEIGVLSELRLYLYYKIQALDTHIQPLFHLRFMGIPMKTDERLNSKQEFHGIYRV